MKMSVKIVLNLDTPNKGETLHAIEGWVSDALARGFNDLVEPAEVTSWEVREGGR